MHNVKVHKKSKHTLTTTFEITINWGFKGNKKNSRQVKNYSKRLFYNFQTWIVRVEDNEYVPSLVWTLWEIRNRIVTLVFFPV